MKCSHTMYEQQFTKHSLIYMRICISTQCLYSKFMCATQHFGWLFEHHNEITALIYTQPLQLSNVSFHTHTIQWHMFNITKYMYRHGDRRKDTQKSGERFRISISRTQHPPCSCWMFVCVMYVYVGRKSDR